MIKRLMLGAFLVLVCVIPVVVAADTGLSIASFHSDIAIEVEGTVKVVETIEVDFKTDHHGIYRDLPIAYGKDDGSTHYTEINDIETLLDRSPVRFELIKNDANLRIKIGDPNQLISGLHTYTLTYRVTGVLANYGDHDELYWNVNGAGWEVWTMAISASVRVANTPITQVRCFVGTTGSTEACDSAIVSPGRAQFKSLRPLANTEGMTIGVAYAPGVIPILTVAEPMRPAPAPFKYIVLGFCIIVLLAAAFIGMTWWYNGRDEYYKRKSLHDPNQSEATLPLFGANEPIVPEYDPPAGLRPAEIGVLMDEKADDVDISATIVDLAVRGYLTITEKEKKGVFMKADYLLTKTNKPANDLLPFEKMLYDRLFSAADKVQTSSLKNKLSATAKKVKEELYTSLVKKKYFTANPEDRRKSFKFTSGTFISASIGFFVVFGGDMLGILPNHEITRALIYGAAAGMLIVGCMLWAVSFFMPKRTALGREIFRQAKGYKLFVSGTEKYRQPFFERENIFMHVLPYAMVFGVTHKLAAAMEEMQIEPAVASWYIGSGPFYYSSFSNSIDGLSNSLSSAVAAAPQSGFGGSGGFSGGGFGGGGGGGW